MNIPCDNMFLLVLYIMTLMTFDHFLKKIDIGDTFWKKNDLEHIYIIWSFVVTKSFYWYQN